MAITVVCKSCKKAYQVKEAMAGRRGKCPQGHELIVPSGSERSSDLDPTVPANPVTSVAAAREPGVSPSRARISLPPRMDGYARVKLLTEGVNVHETNDTKSKEIAKLSMGDMVNIRRGPFAWVTWYQVALADGRTGWFNADFQFLFMGRAGLKKDMVAAYAGPSTSGPATKIPKQREPYYVCSVVETGNQPWFELRDEEGLGGYVLADEVDVLETCAIPGGSNPVLPIMAAAGAGLVGGALTGALAAVGNGTLGLAGFLIWLLTLVGVKGLVPRITASICFAIAAAAVMGVLRLLI